jgi:adenylate cyclase
MMTYCLGHLVNHSMGILSVDAMDAMRIRFMAISRAPGIYWVMPISILVHLVAALTIMMHRRTLRALDRLAKVQVGLGMLLPLLLFVHIAFSRHAYNVTGKELYYSNFFSNMEAGGFVFFISYIVLLMGLVWGHGCLGMHRWLRLKPWYRRYWAGWYTLALLPPVMAFFGSMSGYRETQLRKQDPAWIEKLVDREQWLHPDGTPMDHKEVEALVMPVGAQLIGAFVFTVLLAFSLRFAWLQHQKKKCTISVRFDSGKEIMVAPGTTLLEASQLAGVSHASVCGGHGRCSTCRTRILVGHDELPPPEGEEAKVLERIAASPNVRLACQVRPKQEVYIHPMLQQAESSDGFPRPSYADGQEVDVTLMFADLRGFTKLSDQRLPYDVVFILNQYFELMGEAIESTDGYLDKFIGDGIMAIFGIRSGTAIGAKQAIGAAIKMGKQLEELNSRLTEELEEPLRIGIGLHRGSAIVGNMGYGDTMSVTAIGGTVNTAARLEGVSKKLGVELVISQEVLDAASVELPDVEAQDIEIRGRAEPVKIFAIDKAHLLKPRKVAKNREASL